MAAQQGQPKEDDEGAEPPRARRNDGDGGQGDGDRRRSSEGGDGIGAVDK